jgi:hypothetical protein
MGTVTSGPPIIIDPETGKPYPPNYIPNEQAPGTHEMWTPGSSLGEAKKLQKARLDEFTRSRIETVVRPHEEALVKRLDQGVDQFERGVDNVIKNPGKAISNALGVGEQVAGQAVKTGQQLVGQASKLVLGGGRVQAPQKIGGMDSALVSVAPERMPRTGGVRTGGSAPAAYTGTSASALSRAPRRN